MDGSGRSYLLVQGKVMSAKQGRCPMAEMRGGKTGIRGEIFTASGGTGGKAREAMTHALGGYPALQSP
jgi:hypothetical protein